MVPFSDTLFNYLSWHCFLLKKVIKLISLVVTVTSLAPVASPSRKPVPSPLYISHPTTSLFSVPILFI